jgi:hypothetical protein
MINGFAANLIARFTGANPNAATQAAAAGKILNTEIGDKFARDAQRRDAARTVGAVRSRKRVDDKAGITKPAGAKKK